MAISLSEPEKYAYGIFILFVCILGSLLNLLVAWFFGNKLRRTRSSDDALIASLAVADCLQSSIAYSLNFVRVFDLNEDENNHICLSIGFLTHFLSICSIGHFTLLAIGRYQTVRNNYMRPNSTCLSITCILFLPWFYGLFWSILPILGWSSYATDSKAASCAVKWYSREPLDLSFTITILFTDFILPLIVILYCYIKVINLLRESGMKVTDSSNAGSQAGETESAARRKHVAEEKKLIKIVSILILGFIIAWLPYSAISCLAMAGVPITDTTISLPAYFAKASVLYNPIIYGIKHRRFKRYLIRPRNWARPNHSR